MKRILTFPIFCLMICAAGISHAQIHGTPDIHREAAIAYLKSLPDFSGYILVASRGEILLRYGHGYADRARQIPYTDSTLATIGSITKPFTGTAILTLAEANRLSVSDPLSRFFDDVPADKAAITIHQLLTHSAGFPGAIGDDYAADSTSAFLRQAWAAPLLFAPGTSYAYSNVGYSLLGIILEQITGQTYSTYITEVLFEPAGMHTAGYYRQGVNYDLLAHGYRMDGSDWGTSHDKTWARTREPYWHLKANGGLLMSPLDMFQWYKALRENRILSPEMLSRQLQPHVSEGGDTYYGYGYVVTEDGQRVEHNGGNGIFRADFRWFPREDFAVFTTSHDARVRLFQITDHLLQVLRTGVAPEVINWEPVTRSVAGDPQLTAGTALVRMLQTYSEAAATTFVTQYCTENLIARNGMEKLYALFDRLSQDVGSGPILDMHEADQKLKIWVPGAGDDFRLALLLMFAGEKIDRMSAELEGL